MLRYEDNIEMDLQAVELEDTDWVDMLQGRESWRTFVNAVMNLDVTQNEGNFLTS